MKILGNRILVEKLDEEKKEGEFQVADVQDNFIYKGKVVQVSSMILNEPEKNREFKDLKVGDVVLFAKYSPDIHEVEIEGKKHKIINVEDILAIE